MRRRRRGARTPTRRSGGDEDGTRARAAGAAIVGRILGAKPGLLLILLALPGALACGEDDPAGPGSATARVAGSYDAITWTIATPTGSTDLLAEGARLTLDLAAGGSVAGEFFIPAGLAPEDGQHAADMQGSWTLDENAGIVRFDQPADTYVRLVDWEVDPITLSNEFVNGGYTVTTVLRK